MPALCLMLVRFDYAQNYASIICGSLYVRHEATPTYPPTPTHIHIQLLNGINAVRRLVLNTEFNGKLG